MCHKELDTLIAKVSEHMEEVVRHAKVTTEVLTPLLHPALQDGHQVCIFSQGSIHASQWRG